MKGIILAGGSGTRLYPVTIPIVKQLLPVYDKPMIYYPLSTLMLAGLREILIISTPKDIHKFEELLGDGKRLGMNFYYKVQEHPRGIAEAFIIGEEFIGQDHIWLILGDNIFFGQGLSNLLQTIDKKRKTATVFGYYVSDPQRYGVVEFDKNNKAISIEEKPSKPKSNYAVTGLYHYDNQVCHIARSLKPSWRNELEITDINKYYLAQGLLDVHILGRGFAWLDTGTFDSLSEASSFVNIVEKRQGLKVGCIEEIAYRLGYITKQQVRELARVLEKNSYGEYLLRITEES